MTAKYARFRFDKIYSRHCIRERFPLKKLTSSSTKFRILFYDWRRASDSNHLKSLVCGASGECDRKNAITERVLLLSDAAKQNKYVFVMFEATSGR